MIVIVGALSFTAAIWLWLHFSTAPPPKQQVFYRRALARPAWARGLRGEAHEFVNWVGVTEATWNAVFLPSIEIVKASQRLLPLLRAQGLQPAEGTCALTHAAMCVWGVYRLAGASISKQQAARHAMHVYYYAPFGEDPALAVRTFSDEVVWPDAPPGLQEIQRMLQSAFVVRIEPRLPSAPRRSAPRGAMPTADHCKAE